ILLGVSSYLLIETRVPELMFWAKNYSKDVADSGGKETNIEETIEMLGPTPTPEISTEPTVRLTLEPSRMAKEGADAKDIHLHYGLIHPSLLEVLDSSGDLAVKINLETGETIFGGEYAPDEASKEFWKSLAKNYPEVCILRQNRE
ncbi:MAG: hypothetical protein HY693_05225, partial [Deltaproteobacteria bacterium]|nr:hypothetical protein [Deltaproteobacteria bacterium]